VSDDARRSAHVRSAAATRIPRDDTPDEPTLSDVSSAGYHAAKCLLTQARVLSNHRPLACEAWRSSRLQAWKYLQIDANGRGQERPGMGLIRPNTAGFGLTNGERPVPSRPRQAVRCAGDDRDRSEPGEKLRLEPCVAGSVGIRGASSVLPKQQRAAAARTSDDVGQAPGAAGRRMSAGLTAAMSMTRFSARSLTAASERVQAATRHCAP
jgi:hypothetical protein